MTIQVTCTKCLKRFNVADAHAGKTGACPSCKSPIKIPDRSEEVVIHAPESFGPKDATGRAVLKPIERKEVTLSPVVIGATVGAIAVVFGLAFLVGRLAVATGSAIGLLGFGAVLIGPPLAYAGYGFLRNDELGAFSGRELWLRVFACGWGYAALWGVYAVVVQQVLGGKSPEMYQLAFIIPLFLAVGGGISLAALELDFTNGCLHYAFYLLVAVLLRLTMGLPAV